MGMEESLSRFSAANLGAYIDLEGIGEGTHQVEIQLNLGEELHLAETPKISVKLTPEGQEEPTDNQDAEDEGGESE